MPLLSNCASCADTISRSVGIGSGGGDHLLVIRVQASSGQLSYELCKAIVDAYQEKSADSTIHPIAASTLPELSQRHRAWLRLGPNR